MNTHNSLLRLFLLPTLLALLLQSFLHPIAAFDFADSSPLPYTTIYSSNGTLPSTTSYLYLPFLPSGWSRASLCSSSGIDDLSDCAFQVRLTQLTPSPVDTGCGIGAALQIACTSQTVPDSPFSLAQMICLSGDPLDESRDLFPQDSPNIAWAATIDEPLGQQHRRASSVPSTTAGASPTIGDGYLHQRNPVDLTVTPMRFAEMERVARRNKRPANMRAELSSEKEDSDSDDDTLPLRIVLLTPPSSASTCPGVSYSIEVRVIDNSRCQNELIIPPQTIIIPATNTTNSSTIIIPGSNTTTPVACQSARATCVTTAQGDGGNYTSQCMCEVGFTSPNATVPSPCSIDTGIDLSFDAASARPLDPAATLTPFDASMLWAKVNDRNLKGEIKTVKNIQLDLTQADNNHYQVDTSSILTSNDVTNDVVESSLNAAVNDHVHSYSSSRIYSTPSLSTSSSLSPPQSSSSSSPEDLSSFGYAFFHFNLSRSLLAYSLVVHVTVADPLPHPFEPMQLLFSPHFYPTLQVSTPLACLNGTQSQTPCISLFMTTGSMMQRRAFKLLIQPSVLQGFMNNKQQGGGAAVDDDDELKLYFSLYYQQEATIDVRVWLQDDLFMYVPQGLPKPTAKDELTSDDVKKTGFKSALFKPLTNWIKRFTTASSSAAAASSQSATQATAVSSSSLSHNLVDPLPPYDDVIIWPNQTWVQHMYEDELIFVRFNLTGVASQPESASLYVLINDTSCVSGGLTYGFYSPHWWLSPDLSTDEAAGMSMTGLPAMAHPPVAGVKRGRSMALAGGCIRPDTRNRATPQTWAGLYGQLFAVCETAVQLEVWHVPPMLLVSRTTNTRTNNANELNKQERRI